MHSLALFYEFIHSQISIVRYNVNGVSVKECERTLAIIMMLTCCYMCKYDILSLSSSNLLDLNVLNLQLIIV